jgi:hypothetical protein
MKMGLIVAFTVGAVFGALMGYSSAPGNPNATVKYGETSGLPRNCRAIVQLNIDGYKNKIYSADEVMSSLERNCGTYGMSW